MPTIRALIPSDAPAFADHICRNLPTSGTGTTPIFYARSRHTLLDHPSMVKGCSERWAKLVGEPSWERGWGAFEGSGAEQKIIGAVSLQTGRYLDSQSHRAVLGMGIEDGFRSAGVGSGLMKAAIDWAIGQPFLSWIDLGVFAHNHPARRLYEKFGFSEAGRTIDLFRIDGHSVDDIQMVLDLRQLR